MREHYDNSSSHSAGRFCPRCDYDLRYLPAIYVCPECGYLYVTGVTTESRKRPPFWKRTLLPVAALLGFGLLIALPLVSDVHYLIFRPARPWFTATWYSQSQPVLYTFEAAFGLFLFCAVVVTFLLYARGDSKLTMRHDGIRWSIREGLEEYVPWEVIEGVVLTEPSADVELQLTIGHTIRLPKKVYARDYKAEELCDLIVSTVPKPLFQVRAT